METNNKMAAKPEMSIIVPVYNASNRFRPCMESLVNQTLDHSRYEIVLVDDGSSDGCELICDEYAEVYPSLIRVFHQPPSGHASAPRNHGIKEARGEYIFFQDADDILLPEACERMLAHAREWQSDILVVRQTFRWPDGREEVSPSYAANNNPSVPCGPRFAEALVADMHTRRLYRRDLILDNEIWFKDTLSEDFLFNEEAMYYAKTVSFANDYTYVWYMQWEVGNISSSQHQTEAKSFDGRLRGIKWLLGFIEEKDLHEEAYPYLYKKILEHPVYRMVTTAMDQRSWDEEVCRMSELRDVLLKHWNPFVAEKIKYTERAVLEMLMLGHYDLMPAVRSLAKMSAKARPGFKIEPDWTLGSEGASLVFEPLAGLSEYVRHGLIIRQLNTLEVVEVNPCVRGSRTRFEVSLSFPQMAAMISAVKLVAVGDLGEESIVPLQLVGGSAADPLVFLNEGCSLSFEGDAAFGQLPSGKLALDLVVAIGQDSVSVSGVGVLHRSKSLKARLLGK